ncbi:MAG: ribbon-helix-helix protein, CopG family [Deltaproteobacteria bacterium]|nr:MAG: ribbon-helix-helix protein, CopG family [Deltaproteobacteria bacterium]
MPISIRLSEDIDKRLDFLARQTGRTKAFYIREALMKKIDDLEDYYLAADVLERIRKGEEATHSSAEMRKDLGLDD